MAQKKKASKKKSNVGKKGLANIKAKKEWTEIEWFKDEKTKAATKKKRAAGKKRAAASKKMDSKAMSKLEKASRQKKAIKKFSKAGKK